MEPIFGGVPQPDKSKKPAFANTHSAQNETSDICNIWSEQWRELNSRHPPRKLRLEEIKHSCIQLIPDLHPDFVPQYLQEMTRRTLESLNVMDTECYEDFLRQILCPNFKVSTGIPETPLSADSLDEHIENLRKYLQVNPNYRLCVLSTMIHFPGPLGKATVLTHTRVTGLFGAEDKVRESVNQVVWVRVDERKWQASDLATLRGPGFSAF